MNGRVPFGWVGVSRGSNANPAYDPGAKPRCDGIGNEACHPLFDLQGVLHAAHARGAAFHSQDQGAAGGIREADKGLQGAVRGGEIAFELQRLAFRALEQVEEVHGLGSKLRSAGLRYSSESRMTVGRQRPRNLRANQTKASAASSHRSLDRFSARNALGAHSYEWTGSFRMGRIIRRWLQGVCEAWAIQHRSLFPAVSDRFHSLLELHPSMGSLPRPYTQTAYCVGD